MSSSVPSWCLQIEATVLDQLYSGDVCWIALMARSSGHISGEAVVRLLFALKPLVLGDVRAYGRGIAYSGCTGLWSVIRL